jgi:1,4-dihydroxy-2-naphthoate octaprenyltransferase
MITISYSIGTGLVSYLGKRIDQIHFWLGLLIVLLIYISAEFIVCYFYYLNEYVLKKNKKALILKNNFLVLFFTSLVIIAALSFFITYNANPNFIFLLFLGLFLAFIILYAVPPFNLRKKGFGDFLITINVVSITPMFALFLQYQEIHKTLFLITYPAFFLLISFFLAQSLENYEEDIKAQKNTLMTKLGWKTGMSVHNYFILATYVLYGIAAIFGLPTRLVYPAILSFPVAVIQFWEMWRIGEGYKPRWKLLRISSLSVVCVLSYFLLFNLWLR